MTPHERAFKRRINRTLRSVSQRRLAEVAGISSSQISRYRTGENKTMMLSTMVAISDAIDKIEKELSR